MKHPIIITSKGELKSTIQYCLDLISKPYVDYIKIDSEHLNECIKYLSKITKGSI